MKRLIMIAFTVAAIGPANAVLLYNQDPHTPGATGGNGLSNFQGTLGTTAYDREIVDDFTVTGAGWLVNQVDMTGIWFSAPFTLDPSGGFQVAFFPKVGGVPSPVAFNSQTSTSYTGTMTGAVYFARDARKWLINVTPVALTPGDWYVQIQPINDLNFFQLTSDPTTPINGTECYIRGLAGDLYPVAPTWGPGTVVFGVPHDVAFSIHGDVVPEPCTIMALGLGIAALARRRFRK